MLKYIISLILILSGLRLFGQIEPADTVVRPPKPPKVKKELKEFIPTGVRVGIDLNSFSRNFWDDAKKLTEFQLDLDFRHLLLNFEYGTAKVDETGEDFDYSSDGSYFRVGPEINFLYDPDWLHVVSVGFRYASSSLDDQLIFNTEDAFGTTQIMASNDKAKAEWAELTAGTKINLWKGLFMGFTVRYKFLKSVKYDQLQPHWLPGFGENRLDDNDQFGFSYYLWWRFGFRKEAKPVPIE